MKILSRILIHNLIIFGFFVINVNAISWQSLNNIKSTIFFYAGDMAPNHPAYEKYIGLSLTRDDSHHIKHDVTHPMPLSHNSVDVYQAEDVFEHIEYEKLVFVLNEIYRVLKPGGLLRISIPDYRCDVLYDRSLKNNKGEVIFDAGGEGRFIVAPDGQSGKVIDGGHVWFPTIEKVRALFEKTQFFTHGKIEYLHYYNEQGVSVTNDIDYSKGYVQRTPDHDVRVQKPYRAMSIVVDLYKGK